jgi:hypothetical protein
MLRAIKYKPRGVIVFAMLLILGSLYKLMGFLDYDYYIFMFQQIPLEKIQYRFVMSVGLRVVGIFTAFGLMCHNKWARYMLLFLCVTGILTIYWKHPYSVFENVNIYLEYQRGLNTLPLGTITDQFVYPLYPSDLGNYQLVRPSYPKISMYTFIGIDVIFCASMLWYFTRPRIRALFK